MSNDYFDKLNQERQRAALQKHMTGSETPDYWPFKTEKEPNWKSCVCRNDHGTGYCTTCKGWKS